MNARDRKSDFILQASGSEGGLVRSGFHQAAVWTLGKNVVGDGMPSEWYCCL